MTFDEAIEIINQFRDRQGNSIDDVEAFDMAIKALKQQSCVSKCFICGKEIQRDSIPRVEPKIDKIMLSEDKKEHLVCDTCGNLLTIVFKMEERQNG